VETFINIYIFIYTYIYSYVCIYIYICIYMYTCICIHIYRYMYIYMCIHIYTCIHIYIYAYNIYIHKRTIYIQISIFVNICINVSIRIYIFTYMYILYSHTPTPFATASHARYRSAPAHAAHNGSCTTAQTPKRQAPNRCELQLHVACQQNTSRRLVVFLKCQPTAKFTVYNHHRADFGEFSPASASATPRWVQR